MTDDFLVEAFLDRLIREKNADADQQKLIARGAIFSGIAEAVMADMKQVAVATRRALGFENSLRILDVDAESFRQAAPDEPATVLSCLYRANNSQHRPDYIPSGWRYLDKPNLGYGKIDRVLLTVKDKGGRTAISLYCHDESGTPLAADTITVGENSTVADALAQIDISRYRAVLKEFLSRQYSASQMQALAQDMGRTLRPAAPPQP